MEGFTDDIIVHWVKKMVYIIEAGGGGSGGEGIEAAAVRQGHHYVTPKNKIYWRTGASAATSFLCTLILSYKATAPLESI